MESWPRAINENSNHTFVTNDKKEHDKGELDHRRRPHDLYSPHLGQGMESWPRAINENSNHTFVTNDKIVHDKGELDHRRRPRDLYSPHLGQEMESWPHTTNENSNHTFVTNDKKVHDKGELDHRRRPRDLYSPHLGQEMESWPHTINENSNQSLFKYGVETSDTRKISHQGQDQNQTHHRSVRGLTSFPSFGERGSTPHNDPSYRSEFNNFRANSGKNQLGSNFSFGHGKPNWGSENRCETASGMDRFGGNLWTPAASQVSLYNTVMTSTGMASQSIKESSRHSSNITNDHISLREPPEVKSPLCPTSDLKQSVDLIASTSAKVDTFGITKTTPHSADESLLIDINEGDAISDLNWSLNDKMYHLHQQHSQKISLCSRPKVITSSGTDIVCDISSISSDARYSHPEVDHDLIPGKLSHLDTDWARKKWKFARCFDKMLPRENPSDEHVVSFYAILLKVYEFTSNMIADCLLEYYKKLCLRCNLSYNTAKVGDAINQIQDIVVKSSSVYSDEYLRLCLLFMKYPFSYDFDWFRKATKMVEEEYSIKVPVYPQNQNFVYRILDHTRLGVMHNRFRRVMLRQVGKAWYDKKQYKTKTVFGTNAVLCWEKKSVFVEKNIFRGYLVSVMGVSSDGISMTKDVIHKIQMESTSREEFCQKMGEMFWNSNDYDDQSGLPPVGSTLKTDAVQHSAHSGFDVRGFPGSGPRPPPISDQCSGIQHAAVVGSHTYADREVFRTAALESHPFKSAKPDQSCTDDDGFSDQGVGNQQPLFVHGHSTLTSSDHHETAHTVPVQSDPIMKAKPNRIYTRKDGSEIEEEWIEKYQDWLRIRVDDRWESNCEYINLCQNVPNSISTSLFYITDFTKMKGKGN